MGGPARDSGRSRLRCTSSMTFVDIWFASRRVAVNPAQAAVVLGAAQYDGEPSPVLQARLDRAAELFLDQQVSMVVVTGGGQEGDRTTEAKAGYNYLRQAGVPDAQLRLEVDGTSTYESLAATSRFLRREERRRSDPGDQLLSRPAGAAGGRGVGTGGASVGHVGRKRWPARPRDSGRRRRPAHQFPAAGLDQTVMGRRLRQEPESLAALVAVLISVGCTTEQPTPLDFDGAPVTTASSAVPTTEDPNAASRAMGQQLAEQQCLDDPTKTEGVVEVAQPETGIVVAEIVVDCADVRAGVTSSTQP